MKDVFALYIIEDVQKNEASVNMIAQRRHLFTHTIIRESVNLSITNCDISKIGRNTQNYIRNNIPIYDVIHIFI